MATLLGELGYSVSFEIEIVETGSKPFLAIVATTRDSDGAIVSSVPVRTGRDLERVMTRIRAAASVPASQQPERLRYLARAMRILPAKRQ